MVGEVTAGAAPALGATRSGWRRFFLPVTYGYAVLLIAVAGLLAALGDTAQNKVVLRASTNLSNLLSGNYGTLVSSALVVGDGAVAALIIPLLICLLALAELRFGALTTIRIFVAGHIGATLLVAAGLWVAVTADWVPVSITTAEDVGISYGAMAVIGAFVVLLPGRWRATWAISWLAVAVSGVAMGRTFTNAGHLVALAIGLLAGFWLLRTHPPRLPRLTRFECCLLAIASALGYLMLVG
ncbi:rhomboid-like protein [Nocardia sp. BMG51109]|uniref:rhomboid-like protein n=1 Tax=Nocardia sp. BMG51109 TaxID=1056816 RepID=UPI00068477C5|nr:rhomboid-like protein [Nocardia sp. BMG51109]